MRMSCNGCRVLRKGCTQDCTLRPCLHWLKSPESQANATLFLAKFYGRAGLMNLINAGPDHLRPAIFRSLLYEACGRIINPTYGSVGLMWSGNWHHCQTAVEAVLKGSQIMQIPCDDVPAAAAAAANPITPLKGCDIRHLSKDSNGLHRVRTRNRFKRSGGGHDKAQIESATELETESTQLCISWWDSDHPGQQNRATSHDSFSVETVEASLINRAVKSDSQTKDNEVGLELTLGLNPVVRPHLCTVEHLSDGV